VLALKRGDAKAATQRLDKARELYGDKRPPPVWFWARTLAAALAGDLEQADELGGAAVQEYPAHVVLRNNLAVMCELAGDLQQAEDLVRSALSDEPSLPQLSKNLGDIAYRHSRYDEAWEAYTRAADLAPDLGDDLYFKLGNIAYKRNDRERAGEFWRRALQLNPGHELAKTNLSTIEKLA